MSIDEHPSNDVQFIVRAQHVEGFTTLLNSTICDTSLSWKARGILFYLLSKPQNWRVMLSDIAKQSPTDGKSSVASGLRELEARGYIKRTRRPQVNGRFDGWNIYVYEIPDGTVSDNRTSTVSDFPSPVNRTLQKKEIQNKELQKKEENSSISDLSEQRERLDNVFPIRRARKGSGSES